MRYLILLLSFFYLLIAEETMTLAFLSGLSKDGTPILRVRNYQFVCRPYGILSLNTLIERKELSTSCRKELSLYQKRHPLDLQFPSRHLKAAQKYHYEFIEDECILYSNAQVSYSEVLLKNGLAVMKPLFSDDIWRYRYLSAQKFAKIEKKGVWRNSIVNICIAELYKK